MTLLVSDPEVSATLDAATTVAAMRQALLAAYQGRLVAPPRTAAPLAGGRLVLTAGQLVGQWYGYRSYDTFGHPEAEQLVVLHDAGTGAVRAVAVGEELGSRRTGGLGGVAVDALARPESATLGVIGCGGQAWTQVWATAAVRPLREVTVYSRSAARREAFAARIRAELGLGARAVDSARAAVRDRDVVVLATTSPTPVLTAADLAPGTHLNAVGFKQRGRAEFGSDLLDAAAVLVTDSPAQAGAYLPPMLAAEPPYAARLRDLGAVLAGAASGRTDADQLSVFCSVGLAGTEVFLLDHLVRTLAPAAAG
ncbi:ornithine cyclodeaminase family protein [Micromonospora radicis]|uniref:Ornithine cyclodeaminase family protein n=1 Tax=Micromonospora radicis TaxID=1894971 RepID=A0A418N0S7_9ACTN|nr:ornithine cyclodeaminase family protein [Micromonospora radicis]RIV40788.1 ornithine cyclodeaminase family protein [Micromonospora radicis]